MMITGGWLGKMLEKDKAGTAVLLYEGYMTNM
jgi:hypothetical protein